MHYICKSYCGGAPGLVVMRVFAVHAGSRWFDSHRRNMHERFFRSNRPEFPHPAGSGLKNIDIRVAVGDCSVGGGVCLIKPAKPCTHTLKHYKHNEDERTAPGARYLGFVQLSHSGNFVTRIGFKEQITVRM